MRAQEADATWDEWQAALDVKASRNSVGAHSHLPQHAQPRVVGGAALFVEVKGLQAKGGVRGGEPSSRLGICRGEPSLAAGLVGQVDADHLLGTAGFDGQTGPGYNSPAHTRNAPQNNSGPHVQKTPLGCCTHAAALLTL